MKDLLIAILSTLIITTILITGCIGSAYEEKEKAVFEITGKTIEQYEAEYNKLQNETKKQD